MVDQAMIQADNLLGKERHGSVLVVSARGWHPGVVGLAAYIDSCSGPQSTGLPRVCQYRQPYFSFLEI